MSYTHANIIHMYSDIMKNAEIVETISKLVLCSGGEDVLEHPKIYLEIDPNVGNIVCPYCTKTFVLINN